MKLYSVVSENGIFPGFVKPIFIENGLTYVQHKKGDRPFFARYNILDHYTKLKFDSPDCRFDVEMLYAYSILGDDCSVGNERAIKAYLLKSIGEIADNDFAYLEIALFLGNKQDAYDRVLNMASNVEYEFLSGYIYQKTLEIESAIQQSQQVVSFSALSIQSGNVAYECGHSDDGISAAMRPLTSGEEQMAIEKMLGGNSRYFKLLVSSNLRLVTHIAKKYVGSGMDMDDLVSIGSIGLIKAVASYRPEYVRLPPYASRCIENEILMALRSHKRNRQNLSLSDPVSSDREGNEIALLDILGTDENAASDRAEVNIESARTIHLLGKVLNERERRVLLLRYGLLDGIQHPQHEVADALGISRSYVSRIEKKAFQKLRQAIDNR